MASEKRALSEDEIETLAWELEPQLMKIRKDPRAALADGMAKIRSTMLAEFQAYMTKKHADLDAEFAALKTAEMAQLEAKYTGEFFEQRYATLKRELLAKIENELGPVITTLRRELAAANAELARLRAAQPAH